MWTRACVTAVALVVTLLGWVEVSSGQDGSTPRGCGFLPITELESHFGTQATALRGSDSATGVMCSAELPDRRQGAELLSKPPGPGSLTMDQRLATLKQPLELRGAQVKTFGSIACFTDHMKMAGTQLLTTTCFQETGGYLSLSLRSRDPKHLEMDAVKRLLEKAAAQRGSSG